MAIRILDFDGVISLGDTIHIHFKEILPNNLHPFIEKMTIRDMLKIREDGFTLYCLGGQLALCIPKYQLMLVTTENTMGDPLGTPGIHRCFWDIIVPEVKNSRSGLFKAEVHNDFVIFESEKVLEGEKIKYGINRWMINSINIYNLSNNAELLETNLITLTLKIARDHFTEIKSIISVNTGRVSMIIKTHVEECLEQMRGTFNSKSS